MTQRTIAIGSTVWDNRSGCGWKKTADGVWTSDSGETIGLSDLMAFQWTRPFGRFKNLSLKQPDGAWVTYVPVQRKKKEYELDK